MPRLAVLGLATLAALHLGRLVAMHPSLPLWDEAAHGYAGVQVADAIRHLNPIELFLALNRQSVWPFVHSLLLAPFFLAGGPDFASAEMTSLVLFVATVVLLFLAGRELHPTRGTWVGLAAATLALLAPAYHTFATLAMLEMPGAALLVLAFLLHARAGREPLVPRRLYFAGLATTALFLCKYNYGLLWLAPLAWWEWRQMPEPFRPRAAAARRRRMTWRWWLRPMPALFAIGGLAIVVIALTGGGEFTAFGGRVSMRSPGNLAYALFLLGLVWVLVPRRGRLSRLAWVWARLPERARILARTIALPLAIWFVLPGHVKEFCSFLINRESGPPFWSATGFLFYPRAFVADYSAGTWAGWVVFAFALWPGKPRKDAGANLAEPPARAVALARSAFAVALIFTALHHYRTSRFFLTVCPLLWLCAARNAVALTDAVLARVSFRPLREGLWAGLGIALVLFAWLEAPFDSEVLARRAAFRAPVTLAPALDAILDGIQPRLAAPDYRIASFEPAPSPDPNRDFPARVVLLGYSNVLSPGLLAWWARIARPEIPRAALPKRAPYLAPGAEDVELDARTRWLGAHADLVIVALADTLPPPLAGEYRSETWADRETAARIAESNDWSRVSDARVGSWWVACHQRP